MATSTNYGWAEPDNSSLVKNGASDIRTLGNAIDTSVWNVGFGQAGKNKLINGDFTINQRSFTSSTTSGLYPADRSVVFLTAAAGSVTYSREAFTLGSAPVAGYEAANFIQIVTAGQAAASDNARLQQQVESVRTFAGQTATISFWARATSGTPSIAAAITQSFGTGGSPSATVDNIFGKTAITTSWARYSLTASIASITGKTIGTAGDDHLKVRFYVSAGTDFNTIASSLGVQNNTFQIWGMQLEYGSKATPFQLAGGGAQQAELAMCQRYYWQVPANVTSSGYVFSTSGAYGTFAFPVTMRTAPSATYSATTWSINTFVGGGTSTAVSTLVISNQGVLLQFTKSATMVGGQAHLTNTTDALNSFSAEL